MNYIVEFNLDKVEVPRKVSFFYNGSKFQIETHFLGDNPLLAESMIYNYDNDHVNFLLTSKRNLRRKLSATPARNKIYRGKTIDRLDNANQSDLNLIRDFLINHNQFPDNIEISNSLIELLLDFQRNKYAPETTLETFTNRLLREIKPFPVQSNSKRQIKCAFILHPLNIDYLAKIPYLSPLDKAPRFFKKALENTVAHAPGVKFGQISNIQSLENGASVTCDVYAVWATPRTFSIMPPDKAYSILSKTVEKAEKSGAVICGLGAFTKVVGDSGVSVDKMSDIPVTTGNCLSTATTLWSARRMVEKMQLIKRGQNGRWQGKAMVIGATGSIGKSCAKLLATATDTLVISAPCERKLEQLKKEIQQIDVDVNVITTSNPNTEIHNTDLIITATSVYEGRVLNMKKVKSGSLIVECSRPLNISKKEALSRPDVLVIKSGEVILPGDQVKYGCELNLPKGVVYACLAESVLLALEGLHEPFSLSRDIPPEKVKEIYRLAIKHGISLSPADSITGVVNDQKIQEVVDLVKKR